MTTQAATARANDAHTPSGLTISTVLATSFAALVGQVGLAIPAVLNGLFQQDLGTSSSQLTWISDAFLVPVTLLELTFGVLGDLFGRKRLLIGGSVLLGIGELISVLVPGAGTSTDVRVGLLWTGQALAGIGAAVLFPTSLAMVAAGTHTAQKRARAIAVWAAALSTGGFVSPVLGGLVTRIGWGDDPNASWRWAFAAVAVLALVSALLACAAQNSSAPEGRSLDWPGQITVAVALFALLFAVIQGSTTGWSAPLVIAGFVVAVIFLAAFIAAERRAQHPLLRLELFESRPFAVASVVTVIGMFSFLGTAYATSIRLSAIQGFSPLKSATAFVLLQGFALVLMPLTARVIHSYNPRWALGGGFALIAAGDLWVSTISVDGAGVGTVAAPLALVGIGFAFALSGVTAVSINSVPTHLAGMASGATSQLRDFGFTLGPAVVGAIALSRAASEIQSKIASSPSLQSALATFRQAPMHVPAAQRASVSEAVGAVNSGPLGANGVPATVPGANGKPMPFNPLKDIAYHALDHAYSIGFLTCGLAALLAAILAATALRGVADRPVAAPDGSVAAPDGSIAAPDGSGDEDGALAG